MSLKLVEVRTLWEKGMIYCDKYQNSKWFKNIKKSFTIEKGVFWFLKFSTNGENNTYFVLVVGILCILLLLVKLILCRFLFIVNS